MMRIMFVDDEPSFLSHLRQMLRHKQPEWDMQFHLSGAQALEAIAEQPVDVIVSDMRMPQMDGAQLLSTIRSEHPGTIRIALSGQTATHMVYRCVEHAHQFLAKPCDAQTLTDSISRAIALQELLADEELASLVAGLTSLPSMPEQYRLIMQELQSEEPSLNRIGAIVETDLAMSVKILQLVNSAFFGLSREVTSPQDAATYLGIDVLKGLVLSTGVFSQFDQDKLNAKDLASVWRRSLRRGNLARTIATDVTGDNLTADYAYMAGLLADVGKLVLACNAPDRLVEAGGERPHRPGVGSDADAAAPERSHMEVGAYLLALWGLPNPVVEAVAFHQQPKDCAGARFTPLSAVYMASTLVHGEIAEALVELDEAYIVELGLSLNEVEEWRRLDQA